MRHRSSLLPQGHAKSNKKTGGVRDGIRWSAVGGTARPPAAGGGNVGQASRCRLAHGAEFATAQPSPPAVDHIEARGGDLFQEVRQQDLEGIVTKRRAGVYHPGAPTWGEVQNPESAPAVGRQERMRAR